MKSKIPALLILGATLFGCYPQGPDSTDDFNLVVTNHDPSFNFSTLRTFAMPDSVIKITGNYIKGDSLSFVNPIYANVVLSAIRENLQKRGWTEVDKTASPNVIILPSAIQNVNTIYYDYAYYYDYYYWGWYYPYYYWSGWYYPYPVYGGSYSTGSVFIQMVYPAGITPSDNVPVLWTALLNGLLDESVSIFTSRTNSMVDQAFAQSPYLSVNNRN